MPCWPSRTRASSSTAAWTTKACCAPRWPTWARPRARAPPPSPCRWRATVYCLREKTFTRKIYEILLTLKLEHLLSKDQILELYMNQIFLGNRAYGFAAACEDLFRQAAEGHLHGRSSHAGRPTQGPIGLQPDQQPQARPHPPAVHHRAHAGKRLHHGRAGHSRPRKKPLKLRSSTDSTRVHAEYVAEMARQLIFAQYGTEAYTRAA